MKKLLISIIFVSILAHADQKKLACASSSSEAFTEYSAKLIYEFCMKDYIQPMMACATESRQAKTEYSAKIFYDNCLKNSQPFRSCAGQSMAAQTD